MADDNSVLVIDETGCMRGARVLLVSHWPVDSNAAMMLTSTTFDEMRKDGSTGRSKAFRRAMLALADRDERGRTARPSVWAPFVVLDEGAARLRIDRV